MGPPVMQTNRLDGNAWGLSREARDICEGCELLIADFGLRGRRMIGWRVSRSRAGVNHQAGK